MELKTTFSDPRRRNLAILAALALASVLLAVLALDRRAAEVAPKYPPQTFFPGLSGRLGEVTRIHIESKKDGTFDVAFVPMKGWVLPGRSNYPASFEEVRKTLRSLADLQTVEPKTARPDWFHYVDLEAPPKGEGVLISLRGDRDRVLASLIVGKNEDVGGDSDSVALFVRKPGETQSWLASSPFAPQASPSDWLRKNVVDVDRSRIQEVDVRPPAGAAYTVRRDKPSDADFALTPVPRGREVSDPGSPDGVASAIADFSFTDVRPAVDFDFDDQSWHTVTRTFDGLIVSADVVKQGADTWARVYADAVPGKPDAAREAHDINADAQGWAYKLSAYKGTQFTTPVDGLLKPRTSAKAGK
ncbi:MAG: DUF4340 domain-containing protein [Alphaproteobacteria bacterium]|nr:DUF4340 domain-containing protein [Alphaproteobacteria bacterium]MDE2629736.1 DUF4340 domain-containing protein [Alphaproteobacteria bacterium]